MKRKILTVFLAFAMLVSVAFAYSPKTFAVVSTEEENLSGVYYISNAEAKGSFIDVVDSVNGREVQTHHMASRDQSWTLEWIGNGAYRIKSNLSGYYLTVDNNSSSNGASVFVTNYTGASGQKWDFTEQDAGYEIGASCSNYYLSAPVTSSSNGEVPSDGTTLGMYRRTFDGYDQECWILHRVSDYTLRVDADYDDAYVERYGTAVSSRIDNELLWLKYRMMVYAGIRVDFNINYDNVDTYLDTGSSSCNAHASKTSKCNCGTCMNSVPTNLRNCHHTNYHNILYRLTNPTQSTNIRVVFSGHDMCEVSNATHTDSTTESHIFSAAWKDKDIILMFDFYKDVDYHERMIMIRNIFEFYGLSEHLNINDDRCADDCLFGAGAADRDVVEMCMLCDYCKAQLVANIDEYNHSNG